MDYVAFKPEDSEIFLKSNVLKYKIMIVDDEEEVHKVTHLILGDLELEGSPLELLSAYSFAEARDVMAVHPDIAVALIDVVMETNNAGLDLVRHIREAMKNQMMRIILRTGQPGVAPEERVIIDYDINDYKGKTELTSQRLITSVIACVRSYRDIVSIDFSRKCLRNIIDASGPLYNYRDKPLQEFLDVLLAQLVLFHLLSGEYGTVEGFIMIQDNGGFHLAAATEHYRAKLGSRLLELDDAHAANMIRGLVEKSEEQLVADTEGYAIYHMGSDNSASVVYMRCATRIHEDMLRIFMTNVARSLDNFILNRNALVTEREVISTLSEIVENRDMSTAYHIKRVSEYAAVMSRSYGLDAETCEKLKVACMMHDVGKIGISDQILLKPGALEPGEFEKIKEHAMIGHRILQNSPLPIMKMAAEIALGHHERWDGTGYPNRMRDTDIPLFARMISVLDVFDALTHKRIYKEPWSVEEAFVYIKEQRGAMFDPKMVDLFFSIEDEIMAIWNAYPDEG